MTAATGGPAAFPRRRRPAPAGRSRPRGRSGPPLSPRRGTSTTAAAMVSAKSPARRLNCLKPTLAEGDGLGRRASMSSSSGSRAVVNTVWKNSEAGIRRSPAGPGRHHLGVEQPGDHTPFGGRIGVGQAPPEGAPDTNGKVPHVPGGHAQQPAQRPVIHRPLQSGVAHHRPHPEDHAVVGEAVQLGHPVDVDQHLRAGQTEVHGGTRLWPPARTFASPPLWARTDTASAAVRTW